MLLPDQNHHYLLSFGTEIVIAIFAPVDDDDCGGNFLSAFLDKKE